MKYVVCVTIGMILGLIIYEKTIMANVVYSRASDLGLMQYDGDLDEMVPDTLKYELRYIAKGTMK